MQFQRLRLSGFKSFVEPTDFRIEPGLTAVVGPNGCGKSNLLEALRWVMGANSAKAMRADGMDDVIFGGAGDRPARNRAEVLLQIDNSDRTAPAQFNDTSVIEVVRRIDRGAGSTYRINGVESRARDVQLLFADASTGANSPALVRQGQISELIGAKPSNRRRILEEAAGVSGLHTRRHEADLRLRAAEANLARLDDVNAELETTFNRLKREARQAEKYKRLSAEIRALQGAALLVRWREAAASLDAAKADAARAEAAVASTTSEAARLTTLAATTSQALKPLREDEAVAAAILQRLAIDHDRLEREAALALAEVERLKGDLTRIGQDQARETQTQEDAETALARFARDLEEVKRAIAAAPEREPELKAQLTAAEAARAKADAEVEQLAAEAAAEEARRQAQRARLDELDDAAKAAARRLEEAKGRHARTRRALESTEADRAGVAIPAAEPAAALAALSAAQAELQRVRAAVTEAEAERAKATDAEAAARDAARTADDALRQRRTEAAGLDKLLDSGTARAFPAALEAITPAPGYEAAVAAAFGEDLDAALDARAPAFWAGADAAPPSWPTGVEALSTHVNAPPALAARLALTGLIARGDADRLRSVLPIGARLVSREGDLWRWDGLVVRAEAPRPAAKRLEQKTRRAALAAEIASAEPEAAALSDRHRASQTAVVRAEESLRAARKGPEAAERALAHAREIAERHAREEARREARLQSLEDAVARFRLDVDEAEAAVKTAQGDAKSAADALELVQTNTPTAAANGPSPALLAARTMASAAREAEARARAGLDQEVRAKEGRLRRRDGLTRDVSDWRRRMETAAARLVHLDTERTRADAPLLAARSAPDQTKERTARLLDEIGLAEARRTKAADALAAADAAASEADRAARAADRDAAAAREQRAAEQARLEAANERRLAADRAGAPDDAAGTRSAGTRPVGRSRRHSNRRRRHRRPSGGRWNETAMRWAPSTCAPKRKRASTQRGWRPCGSNAPTSPARSCACALPLRS